MRATSPGGQCSTLLHFIAKKLKEISPEYMEFYHDLKNVREANTQGMNGLHTHCISINRIVNLMNLMVNMKSLELGFTSLKDAVTAHVSQSANDMFSPIMESFIGETEPRLKELIDQFEETKTAAAEMAQWLGEGNSNLSDGALERIFHTLISFSGKLRDAAAVSDRQ